MKNKSTALAILILLLASMSFAQQASNIQFSNASSNAITISWTNGGGTSRAVFIQQSSTGTAAPVNNTTYTANTVYPTGSQIGATGWYCVYNSTGSSVTVTGLTAGSTYRVMVTEYTGAPGSETYDITTASNNPLNFVLANQATNVTFNNIGNTSVTVSWTNGTGTNRAVFVLQGSSGSAAPVNATTYAANTIFPTGSQIGASGWYCVYNGTGTSVTVTGLSAASAYRVMVIEYTGTAGTELYNANTATVNPNNFLTSFLTSVANPSQGNYAVGISVLPTFTWSSTGASSYNLEVSTSSSFTPLITLTGSAGIVGTTYSVNEFQQLTSNTKYYWRVKDNTANAYSATWEFTTFNVQVVLSQYYAYGTSASIAWYITPVSNNVEFDLYYSVNSNMTPTVVVPMGTSTSTTLTNLIPGQQYYVLVRARNAAATVIMNYSTVQTFTIPGLPTPNLSYPTGGTTVYLNPSSLYWYIGTYNPSIEYEVKYWISSGSEQPTPTAQTATSGSFLTGSPNPSTTLTAALTPGATYNWKVRTKLGLTYSATWSPTETFVVYSSTPGGVAPTPQLSWPVGGANSYLNPPSLYWYTGTYTTGLYFEAQWELSSGTWISPSSSGDIIGNLYFNLPSALSAGTYHWRVHSKIGSGGTWGSWSSVETFVIPAAATIVSVPTPSTPSGLINLLNPTFSWSATTPPALDYRVRISTYASVDANGMLNHPTAVSSSWITSGSTSMALSSVPFAPAYTLTAGATYYWQVQSRLNASPNTPSTWSYIVSFSTAAGSALIMPIAGSPSHGQPINNTSAVLSWVLPSKSDVHLKYNVEYSKTNDFKNSTVVKDINEPVASVKGLDANSTYYWRVASKNDLNGSVSDYSEPASFKTGNATAIEGETLPVEFSLEQNYPNPFNPTTIINYSLPNNSTVSLRIYDMLGREVKSLVNSEVAAGKHTIEWKGDDNSGNKVATGVYIYRITAGNFISSKKMLLVK